MSEQINAVELTSRAGTHDGQFVDSIDMSSSRPARDGEHVGTMEVTTGPARGLASDSTVEALSREVQYLRAELERERQERVGLMIALQRGT